MIVFIICSIALLIRLYNLNESAIFLSDQAIDSYAVNNIIHKQFTLLGPRASVGQFFNGPAVYYLMAPFFLIWKSDPLSGAYFQIFLQILTIPFLYMVTKRFGGHRSGYLAMIIFAISPLFIYYSKAAFNAYPAIFMTTIIIYILSGSDTKVKHFVLAGFMSGLLVQTHYLLYIYAFYYFIYLLHRRNVVNTAAFIGGGTIGLSPFIASELRHDFFNIRAIAAHLISGNGEKVELTIRIKQFFSSVSQLIGSQNLLVGISIFVIVIFGIALISKSLKHKMNIFTFSLLALLVSLVIYKGTVQTHYIIGIYIIMIISIAIVIGRAIKRTKYAYVPLAILLLWILYQTHANFEVPREQDRFGQLDQRYAATLIISQVEEFTRTDTTIKWNVTQDLQKDNRAMPIRYILSLTTVLQPLDFTQYPQAEYLFVIKKKSKNYIDIKTWEVSAFVSRKPIASWPINKDIELILFQKNAGQVSHFD